MTGIHIGVHDQLVAVGAPVAQPGDPLGRLEILHLGVVQAGGYHHIRIVLRADLVVGSEGAQGRGSRFVCIHPAGRVLRILAPGPRHLQRGLGFGSN